MPNPEISLLNTYCCSVYQEHLAKKLADKYASLNTQMDKIIHDANTEISSLRNRISSKSHCAFYKPKTLRLDRPATGPRKSQAEK